MEAVLLTVAICVGVAIYVAVSALLKLPEWKICLDYTKKIVQRIMARDQSRGESL